MSKVIQTQSKLKLTKTSKKTFYVSFYIGDKRYRYSDGKVIGRKLQPNRLDPKVRQEAASELLLAFRDKLNSGWAPVNDSDNGTVYSRIERFESDSHLTTKYRKALRGTRDRFLLFLKRVVQDEHAIIDKKLLEEYFAYTTSTPSTFNHERARLQVILNQVLESAESEPIRSIKKKREKQELHKPFGNVAEVLEDIRKFNKNLHLCCLLTYGCLLRPHQEIRNLRWSDFSEDLSFISLSGKRNKSGRNRIVPIPQFVREYLIGGSEQDNIFTGKTEPYANGYFKVLWRRYSRQSDQIFHDQTLYSFRHSGALNIFSKTGSLVKLQTAMGHSNLNVTLTYLRGLEVPSISKEDMPDI